MHKRTQSMRNDQGHTILGEAPHRRPNPLLSAGVDRRGGIIENEHRWPQHEAAGDREALSLPAGKRCPALANHSGITGRESDNVIVQLRRFGGAFDALLARPRVTVGYIVLNRGREQERILLHDAHRLAQGLQRHPGDVLTVDGDSTRTHVIETWNQLRYGRLSTARRADNADCFTSLRL